MKNTAPNTSPTLPSPKPPPPSQQLHIRLDPDVYEALTTEASRRGKRVIDLVREAIAAAVGTCPSCGSCGSANGTRRRRSAA